LKEEGEKLKFNGGKNMRPLDRDILVSEILITRLSFKDSRNYFKADIDRLHLPFEGERERIISALLTVLQCLIACGC